MQREFLLILLLGSLFYSCSFRKSLEEFDTVKQETKYFLTDTTEEQSSVQVPAVQDEVLPQQDIQHENVEELDTYEESPDGEYLFRSGYDKTELTISGNSWYTTTTINSGFGESYDAEQAMTERGLVDGLTLYDETGYVRLGKLEKNRNGEWSVTLTGMRFRKK